MRFIIEHLEKHFDKKEVLKDIDAGVPDRAGVSEVLSGY